MTCMKCNVEIPEGQVFCDRCLSVMEQHPVNPGSHIHLPKRLEEPEAPKKAKKKRNLSTEEQISALKLKVLRTRLIAVILAFLLCVASAFLAMKVLEDSFSPITGRNYTIDPSIND